MVVPEINPEHFKGNRVPEKRLGNQERLRCSKAELLHSELCSGTYRMEEFEPYGVVATTYQAISGAGKTFKDWPEMEGNIIPYIGGEEEKE